MVPYGGWHRFVKKFAKGNKHEYLSLYSGNGGRHLFDPHASVDADSRENTKSFCEIVFILCTLCLFDGHDVSCGVSCGGSCCGSGGWRDCCDPAGA